MFSSGVGGKTLIATILAEKYVLAQKIKKNDIIISDGNEYKITDIMFIKMKIIEHSKMYVDTVNINAPEYKRGFLFYYNQILEKDSDGNIKYK